jgi:hypothetical protein
MSDLSGLNLKQPTKTDWDNYNPGSKFMAPPPALGVDGKPVLYYGQVPKTFEFGADDEGNLNALIDPIVLVKGGQGVDGYTIRFTRVSVKPFKKGDKPINAHSMGNYLRSAQVQAKPQTNEEYAAAVRATAGRVIPVTIDWVARNKDTGEEVKGFLNFPEDPERPGQRKAILKAGDTYTVRDNKGNILETRTVTSEVLFANAKVRYYVDPSRAAK